MKHNLVILGAGGHGKVVAEAAILSYNVIGFADDHTSVGTEILKGIPVIASTKEIKKITSYATHFIVAIGNNQIRKNIFDSFSIHLRAATVVHSSAVVSESSKIGSGSVVLANAVVNTGCQVGKNCILNSSSLTDHDTVIGNHTHVSQGTIIGSNCYIPEMFTSELGQCIKSHSTI